MIESVNKRCNGRHLRSPYNGRLNIMVARFYVTVDGWDIIKETSKVIRAQASQESWFKQCMRDHHGLTNQVEMKVDTNLIEMGHTGSQLRHLQCQGPGILRR